MELSISLEYLRRQRGTKALRDFGQTVKLCREAGFRFVDYSGPYRTEDWKAQAYVQREILDKAGIAVEQTHAHFNRYGTYDGDIFWEYYRRLFETSAILGAKYVVVHGDEYATAEHYDEKEIVEYTYGYLAPFADFAAAHGMTVAIENLFEDVVPGRPQIDGKSRFTARLSELQSIIDRFHASHVACCWDFGHARCAFGDEGMLDAMKTMGSKIVCTHVHDNYYGKDLHLMPFLGDTAWEPHMKHLGEIGYAGKLSFEFVYGHIPDSLLPMWLEETQRVGQTLIQLSDAR